MRLDGDEYTVRQIVAGQAMCALGEEDDGDDWEMLPVEDVAGMLREEREVVVHAPSPDVRLVRDMWVRRGGRARVHAVKFMWGLFACNDLLHRRFGRGDSGHCSSCTGETESAWHVIGECGEAQARELRSKWAERMWTEVSAELSHAHSPLDVRVAKAAAVSKNAAFGGAGRETAAGGTGAEAAQWGERGAGAAAAREAGAGATAQAGGCGRARQGAEAAAGGGGES